jgi:general secretion pathway protein G
MKRYSAVDPAYAHCYPKYFHETLERHSRAGGNPILREHSKQMPVARDEIGFPPPRERRANEFKSARSAVSGFTLIELLVVLAIVALLLTLAMPRFFPSVDNARETILADNLRNTRAVIDQYYADTGRYPDSLEQLVEKKYLRNVPVDPVAGGSDSWIIVPPEDTDKGAVYSIKSGAPGNGHDGRPYQEW